MGRAASVEDFPVCPLDVVCEGFSGFFDLVWAWWVLGEEEGEGSRFEGLDPLLLLLRVY